jgi:cytochrome P450
MESQADVAPDADLAGPLGFNPLDPAFRVDPYPVYARLRERGRVLPSPMIPGLALATRYAECNSMLRDPRWGSDERKSTFGQMMKEAGAFPDLPPQLQDMDPFLFMDPPDHTRLRGLVAKAFTPRVVEGLRPRMEEVVERLLRPALAAGGMDVISELAYPLPVTIISEMLGVPVEDQERFTAWSRVLAASLDPDFGMADPAVTEVRTRTMLEFVEYLQGLIAVRRKAPTADLLSALVAVEEEGQRLSEKELLATCILLLVAGHETTVNLIGNGVLAFSRHLDEYGHLVAEPSLVRSAVDEVLRFDAPIQMTVRTALDDMELAGQEIAKGSTVVVLVASANRDPEQFPDPDRFDVGRGDSHHLAFGFGSHFCLGASLARAEGVAALGRLAAEVSSLRLGADPPYKDSFVLRGLAELPVEFS